MTERLKALFRTTGCQGKRLLARNEKEHCSKKEHGVEGRRIRIQPKMEFCRRLLLFQGNGGGQIYRRDVRSEARARSPDPGQTCQNVRESISRGLQSRIRYLTRCNTAGKTGRSWFAPARLKPENSCSGESPYWRNEVLKVKLAQASRCALKVRPRERRERLLETLGEGSGAEYGEIGHRACVCYPWVARMISSQKIISN